jgi:hypothetical protein
MSRTLPGLQDVVLPNGLGIKNIYAYCNTWSINRYVYSFEIFYSVLVLSKYLRLWCKGQVVIQIENKYPFFVRDCIPFRYENK